MKKEKSTSFFLKGGPFLLGIFVIAWSSSAHPVSVAEAPAQTASSAELVLQTGHAMSVEAMAFSPDGKWLASRSVDNTVKLWEVATGREVRTFAGHTLGVKAVAFSRDGRLLA